MEFIDHALARRIELADAANSRRCGEMLAASHPDMGACTLDVAGIAGADAVAGTAGRDGGYAIFAGVGSPMTQAIGLGMSRPVTAVEMDAMERFFESRGSRTEVECSPFCDASLLEQFNQRGYRPFEWSNVLFQRLSSGVPPELPPGVEIRQATIDDADLWAELLCRGFAEELGETAMQLMPVGKALFQAAAAGYIATVDGEPAGGATLFIHDDVAGLMGAATLGRYRRRGVQLALLQVRVDYARRHGCDLAYTITAPGSGSQRNVERAGFRVAYTRTKFYNCYGVRK